MRVTDGCLAQRTVVTLGGVFKPLAAVNLPERAEVELTVADRAGFEEWWRAHSERMKGRATGIAREEIDSDELRGTVVPWLRSHGAATHRAYV